MSRFKPTPGRTTPTRPILKPLAKPSASQPAQVAPVTRAPVGTISSSALTLQHPELVAQAEEIKDPQWRAAVLNTTRRMAFFFTLGFIFCRFSFVHEFIAGHFWIDFHILLVFGALSMIACLASGQLFVGVANTPVKIWLCFFVCMCFAAIFSSWRGNSMALLSAYARTNMPLLLLIPGVAVTVVDIKKVIRTIGYGGATAIVLGFFSNDYNGGRLEIQTAAGTIQNSNDFAALIILVLPAIAYTAFARKNVAVKIAGLAVMGVAAVELIGTGSRGALVAVIAMAVYLFFRGSTKLRSGLVLGVPILLAIIVPFAPQSAMQRMTSLFSSANESEEAQESRMARRALFDAAVDITFHHPLLGVGVGEFEDYQGGMAAAAGQHGMWHETHNGYLQISSECGIPAALCFIGGIFFTLRSLRSAKKANIPIISPIAQTMSVTVIGYSVCLVFLSQGYSFVPPVLAAIAAAIERYIRHSQFTTQESTVRVA